MGILDILRQGITIILLFGGLFFYLVGVIGLIRMPDVFCRLHASTKCDTLGAGMIFIGLIIWQGINFASLNILIILIFIWLTMPTAAHYIANSEYENQKTQAKDES